MNEIYIDAIDGNDNNPGTKKLPLKTLNGIVREGQHLRVWFKNNDECFDAVANHISEAPALVFEDYD